MMTAGITCTRVAIAEYQLYNNSMSTTNWIVTTLLLHSITHTFRHLFTWLAAGRAMHGGWKRAVCTHQHAAWLAPSSVQALTRARFWPPGCQVQIPHPVCLPVAILLSCSVSAAMHGHVNSITPQVCMSSLNTSEFCQVEGHNCPESQRLTLSSIICAISICIIAGMPIGMTKSHTGSCSGLSIPDPRGRQVCSMNK